MEKAMRLNPQRMFAFLALGVLWLCLISPAHSQVKVTSADPASTYQGTISLDVTVSGSGFDNSAKAQFFVTGTTNPGGVIVKKVQFRNSKELIATIDVADTAVVTSFDILVTLSDGRKGKGTTLFAVQSKTSDPCARIGLEFPAFVYVKGSGTTQQIYVADMSGTCSRPLFQVTDGFSAGPSLSFSYPVAGTNDRGRVVWLEGTQVVGGDFTVAATNVTLGARQVYLSGVDCCALTLNPTGDYLYVSTAQRTLSKIAVENPADRTVIKNLTDDGWFVNASANGTDSALFVDERRAVGTQISGRQLIRIDLGTLTSTVLVPENSSQFWPAADPTSNRIAYTYYLVGSNNCYQVLIADGTTGAVISYGQPRYGTGATWLGGRVLSNGYTAPSRRNQCSSTGKVTQVDPGSGLETPLLTGYDPDGN
jgi:hypothetical protein